MVQAISKESNKQISSVIGEALKQYSERAGRRTEPSTRGLSKGESSSLIKNRGDIIRSSRAIIVALEEALDYDPLRHHNRPPPNLRIEDSAYLDETRKLVGELKKLNSTLEKLSAKNLKATKNRVGRIGKHFDKFFSSYANTLGKGTAGLTIVAVASLLYKAGVGTDIIDMIWRHWKHE